MRRVFLFLLVGLLTLEAQASDDASREPLRVYLDADLSHTVHVGYSIELGIRAALHDLGGTLGGREVEVMTRDHRGNSRRSRKHLDEFSKDPRALAVFCGLHSPPVLSNLDFVHEREILLLDPWAAAGPITRYSADPNWVFRLSVDDTKAGEVIVGHVVDDLGNARPHLILERTGWGRSNEASMTRALAERGIADPKIHWFDWNVRPAEAENLAKAVVQQGGDSVLLVANAMEAKRLLHALARAVPAGERLVVGSHWGVLGDDIANVIPATPEYRLDVSWIQPKNPYESHVAPPERIRAILDRARAKFPDLLIGGELGSAVGFANAYDLTLLLDAAVHQAPPRHEDIREARRAVRSALEKLDGPIAGILQVYARPFGHPRTGPDAHEALRAEDFEMVQRRQLAARAKP